MKFVNLIGRARGRKFAKCLKARHVRFHFRGRTFSTGRRRPGSRRWPIISSRAVRRARKQMPKFNFAAALTGENKLNALPRRLQNAYAPAVQMRLADHLSADTGEPAEYNRPLLRLSKFFIKRRVLIKNVRTARETVAVCRGQVSQYYTILKNTDCLSRCANTRPNVSARRFARVIRTKGLTRPRNDISARIYYNCVRKLFRIS